MMYCTTLREIRRELRRDLKILASLQRHLKAIRAIDAKKGKPRRTSIKAGDYVTPLNLKEQGLGAVLFVHQIQSINDKVVHWVSLFGEKGSTRNTQHLVRITSQDGLSSIVLESLIYQIQSVTINLAFDMTRDAEDKDVLVDCATELIVKHKKRMLP